MERNEKTLEEFKLNDYANLYIKRKEEQKALEDEVKAINTRLKQMMKDLDVLEAEGDNAVVKYVVQNRETLDEEKAIKILKNYCPHVIKTKEYIDMDALEKELYHEKIPPIGMSELDKCRSVKKVVTLTISKRKD